MLRVREKTPGTYEVAISYTTTCPVEELDSCIATVKADIGSSLEKLALNANSFDEVKIDTAGHLHCKNLAPVDEPESTDDDDS